MGYSDYSHGYSEYSDTVRITTFSTFIAVLRYGAADPKNHDYVVIEGGEFKKGGKIITFSVRRTQHANVQHVSLQHTMGRMHHATCSKQRANCNMPCVRRAAGSSCSPRPDRP